MGFSYDFGADTALLADAVSKYGSISTEYNNAYISAKPSIEALKNSLMANNNTAEWEAKINKVINILDEIDAMFKKNTNNLGQINTRVGEMADKMQSAVQQMW